MAVPVERRIVDSLVALAVVVVGVGVVEVEVGAGVGRRLVEGRVGGARAAKSCQP